MPAIRPTGHWTKSPRHKVAWALNQVLAKRNDDQKRRAIAAWTYRIDKAIVKALRRINWNAWARKHLRVVQTETKKSLKRIREPVAKALELDGVADLEDIMPDIDLTEVEGMVRKMYQEAGKQAWALGSPTTVALAFPQKQFDAAMAAAFENVKGVGDTVKSRMRSIMRETMDNSQTFADFGRNLARTFPDLGRSRANAIAVTEYNNAASQTTQFLMEAQGQPLKQSNSVGDGNVCRVCLANEAQGPIPTGDEFQSGHKCPAFHPLCRCNVSSGDPNWTPPDSEE